MKNNLSDLNNYLFEELERLNEDEELNTDDNFEKELKRSKAIIGIAKEIIDNASVELEALKFATEYGKDKKEIPKLFLGDGNETD